MLTSKRLLIRDINYFVGLSFAVVISLLSCFLWMTWDAENRHMAKELANNLRFGVDFCEGYFQRVGSVQRMFGHELLQETGQISSEKATLMLNNYKAINHDQRRFILLSAKGEVIADTDITAVGQRSYYLSEIPAQQALRPEKEAVEKLEFDDTQTGMPDENLVLPLRYVIRDAAGETRYLLQSRLQVGMLRSLWNVTLIPQQSTVGFIHDSGRLVSRYSASGNAESAKAFGLSSARVLAAHLQAENFPVQGVMTTPGAADAVDDLVAYQRLASHPITLFMSIPMKHIRAEWWTRVRVPIVLTVLLLLMGAVMHQLIVRYHNKESRSRLKQMWLQKMAQGVLKAQEEEKARISHELHDEIGQSLTALKITLNRSLQSLQEPDQARSLLAGGQKMVDGMMKEVRGIAHRLRPAELDQLGLAAALRSYLERTDHSLLQEAVLLENIGDRRFSPELELCCFRVAQEALTNCLRHARATRFRISISHQDSRLTLVVADNGIGFDTRPQYFSEERLRSLGLMGMRERVLANGGEFRIRSLRNRGTAIKTSFETGMDGNI